ncbi:MAG: LysR family transcriptional regulator [Acidocella sp. 20-61-6]|nr:MAG: LysR family transcriptional regulator [Acidocella sp. 20-61-6]
MHLGQSAVSAAIAALEARHGAKLFHRAGRGVALTQAGQMLLEAARGILAQTAAAELMLAELAGGRRGTLKLQASQTIASYWLPRYLAAFRQALPEVALELTIGNTAQVAEAVLQGKAELGFIEGEIEAASLLVDEIARDRMLIVVGPEHPWADQQIAPAAVLAGDWVLREPGSGTRSVFEQAVLGFGFDPHSLRVALELPSNEAVRAAVEAGLGATALSASVAAPSLETGLLRQVFLPLPDRGFYAIRHAERYLSRAAEQFMQDVVRVLR